MSAGHTPGADYASEAYRACLYGHADRQQQQSAASQIALLHGRKGELLEALRPFAALLEQAAARDLTDNANVLCQVSVNDMRRAHDAIAKATGSTS